MPGIARAQFTTFIPPVNKTADSVKAAVVAEQKVQQDSVTTAQMTNMKTWVDSAAGILPTPVTAVDSLGVATKTTTTTPSTRRCSRMAPVRRRRRACCHCCCSSGSASSAPGLPWCSSNRLANECACDQATDVRKRLGLSLCLAGGLTVSFAGGRYAFGAIQRRQRA